MFLLININVEMKTQDVGILKENSWMDPQEYVPKLA